MFHRDFCRPASSITEKFGWLALCYTSTRIDWLTSLVMHLKDRLSAVSVVFFDFGFTLWNEEDAWNGWADWLGVPWPEFFAVLGSVIERGEHHHCVFRAFRPEFDLAHERERRKALGWSDAFRPEQLYPDVIPCLSELQAAGYQTGVAGNHFADFAKTLRRMHAPLNFIGSSEEWGVEKPAPGFFARIAEVSGVTPAQIAYVGDRLDNDVLPAKAAGMVSVFLPRGPWGRIHAQRPQAAEADIRIGLLSELLNRIRPQG